MRNATLGLSTIISSLQTKLNLTKSDHIVVFNLAYGSVKKMLKRTNATIDFIEIQFPTSKQAIISQVCSLISVDSFVLRPGSDPVLRLFAGKSVSLM